MNLPLVLFKILVEENPGTSSLWAIGLQRLLPSSSLAAQQQAHSLPPDPAPKTESLIWEGPCFNKTFFSGFCKLVAGGP